MGEIERFFESERGFLSGVKSIQLTGGEPFLRSDIVSIAETIWSNIPSVFIWFATNALLPEVVIEHTKEMLNIPGRGGIGITVSIDGIGETHDSQRGVEGGYDSVLRTLSGLSELRIRNRDMSLSVGMTLTPLNQREIVSVMDIAEARRADFTIRPVNVSELYYRNESVSGGWDMDTIYKGLKCIEKEYIIYRGVKRAAPVISFISKIPNYLSTGVREAPCSAGSSSFFLDPKGKVYPCLFLEALIGDIRVAPLEESWESSEAKAIRRRIRSGHCPGCWVECETMREIRKDKIGLATAALRAGFMRFA